MADVQTASPLERNKQIYDELGEYLHPTSFPIGIKLLKEGEAVPPKTRFPMKDLGHRFSTCQGYNMARRFGWNMALTKDDMHCSLGVVALGFDKQLQFYREGNLCEGMYTETAEAGARSEAAIDKFPLGQYKTIMFAPLHRAEFVPDVICVYGNSAQVMRLVNAALWKRGGKLTSAFGGRADCSEIIVTPLKTGECQVILPCVGDRIFGQTQDWEMAFSIPWARIDEILEGLRGTHKGGIRYPVTSFLNYQADFPPKYQQLFKLWDAQEGKAAFSGRDRVVAAFKRSYVDCIPAYPIIGCYAGVQEGYSIQEYCSDAKKAIKAQLNTYERTGQDVVLAYTDLAKEAEAVGCGVKYSEGIVPSIDVHVLAEDKGKLAKMNIPDHRSAARLPMFLELCEGLVAAKLPTALGAVVTGPWTVAMLMRGPEHLLLDTVDDPQFIHDLMRFTTDYITRFAEDVAATKIGVSLAEPTGSCSLISPDNYKEFIKPYHQEMVTHFKAKKVGLTVHICGFTNPLYEDLVDAGFTTVSIDTDANHDQLKRLVEVSDGRAVVIGNVDATILDRPSTTREQIEAEVKRCVERAMSKRGAYILSTSCEIPPQSRPEVIRWFMEAARTYGRYPQEVEPQA